MLKDLYELFAHSGFSQNTSDEAYSVEAPRDPVDTFRGSSLPSEVLNIQASHRPLNSLR